MKKMKKDLFKCLNKFKTFLHPLLKKTERYERQIVASLLILVLSLSYLFFFGEPMPSKKSVLKKLDNVTVLVEVKGGSGTGTLFSRKDDKGNLVHFVWTSGHVIDDAMIGPDENMNVSFSDIKISKMNLVGDAMLEKISYSAKVIKFSGIKGDDLALLELVDKNIFVEDDSVEFASPILVVPGTSLYHVGCMYGSSGYNSVSEGMLANNGRMIYGKVFDQSSTTVFPGSSGGGIFNERGEYVGMITMMREANMNYFIPVRRMMVWAQDNHLEWALNRDIRMPREWVRHNQMKDAELDSELERFQYFSFKQWKKQQDKQKDLSDQISKLKENLDSLRKELGRTNIIHQAKPTNSVPSLRFHFFGPNDEEEDSDYDCGRH